MFKTPSQRNEAIRITLAITLCMLMGQVLNFDSSIYLALYPTIAMTKVKDYSWSGLFKTFSPTFISACVALWVAEVFQSHPFIIWTVSLLFINYMRKRADTPAKVGASIMPIFNWVLIVIFSQFSTQGMPDRIGEILLSMVITSCIAKGLVTLFPVQEKGQAPILKRVKVTHKQGVVAMVLIGGGIAVLMNIDLLSATFCMVPVIAAATQVNRQRYLEVISQRFVTQIGGCMIAVLISIVLAGNQTILSYYALILGSTIFAIATAMVKSSKVDRDIHSDAMLATVLPIQLYLGTSSFGLESILLRAWELAVTLGILFLVFQLTRFRENHVQRSQLDT
ncbi:DUF2955 domain-containing protein [Shewanella violacea]|uniref:DUF2955 domain-containing protein n=1 Tax=Shewanella violacea (strain JCM 10179 / CIP 106290 / LMG 19151 / DSS12) TaxID=637905 RepID=D4ZMD4_SHEVD|nr:DUF2955 domain-containing protein [Shewanella violacea]BAJ02833.1 hypothetical protein SVI_2862 [Shewanella violacea DSS12]